MRNIEFTRLSDVPSINPDLPVKVTTMGNVVEVQYMEHRNNKQTVQMLPGCNEFVICSTGEIKEVEHHKTRKDNKKGLYKTFAKCRGIINANITDVSKVRWCTLTYKENMTDPKRLYSDFEKFNKKFQYYCKKKGYSKAEYVVMMEPQGRGAWHSHLLYIWQDMKAPYIPNQVFRELWGHGFVKIKKLDNVDNVGAYLTAYLGDMELDEIQGKTDGKIKVVEVEEDGKTVKKSIVKGARLGLYPANFNMLRYSRGCKKPIEEIMYQDEVSKKVLGATKTFESAVKMIDETTGFENTIVKTQYNLIRKKRQ